jgi:hypothetical protein
MDWGTFGVINNHVHSQRVVVMATKKSSDAVWEDIFDSLVLEAEPPQKYIKRVTITTKDGHIFSLSPQDFAALIEQERYLPPGVGEIMSARMSLDFNKIKKDVDKWSEELLGSFDLNGKPAMPKFPKPKAGAPKQPRARTSATTSKTPAAKATASKSKATPTGRKRPTS